MVAKRKQRKNPHSSLIQTAITRTFQPSDLLTDSEVAQYLRIQPHTLRVWRSARKHPQLPFVRVGGRCVRYRFSDVLAWVEGNLQSSTA
jgi:excisionase family DNA binding protein